MPDREPAEVLVAGHPPQHGLRHVAVDPLPGQRRAVQLGEVEVGLAGPLHAGVDGGAVPRELVAVLEDVLVEPVVPALVVVLAEGLEPGGVEARVRSLEVRRSAAGHQRSLSPGSSSSTARKASCGTSTTPSCFIRFLPSFCFSSSLRLRLMSPP